MGSSPSTPKIPEPVPVLHNQASNFHIIASYPVVSPTVQNNSTTQSQQSTPRSREYTPRSNDDDLDTSKDELISKVLSAEEFQAQLDDCDRRIKMFCEADERHLHLKSIESCVSLRGHLQDELLRIVAMLNDQESSLTFLEDFELSNPRIVEILRSLKSNAAASDITIDPIVRCEDVMSPLKATCLTSSGEFGCISTKATDVNLRLHVGNDDYEFNGEEEVADRYLANDGVVEECAEDRALVGSTEGRAGMEHSTDRDRLARDCFDDEIDDLQLGERHRFTDEWNGGREPAMRVTGRPVDTTCSSYGTTEVEVHRQQDGNAVGIVEDSFTSDPESYDVESREIYSNLQVKHEEEEADIVKQYTREIVHLDACEINDVLNSHLLCMQSLRDHQAREKYKFNQSLMEKRKRLLVSRSQNRPSSASSAKTQLSLRSHRPIGLQRNANEKLERNVASVWDDKEERRKFQDFLDNECEESSRSGDLEDVNSWADHDVISDGSYLGQSLKGDDEITSKLISSDVENFADILKEHLKNKALLKCRKNEDKEKFKERLRQRKEQLQTTDKDTSEKLDYLMRQLVEYLSDCHLNGNLSADDIKRVIARYRKEQEKIVKINYSDSASSLLLEHQQQSRHLVHFKNRERQKMNEKLERRLAKSLNS